MRRLRHFLVALALVTAFALATLPSALSQSDPPRKTGESSGGTPPPTTGSGTEAPAGPQLQLKYFTHYAGEDRGACDASQLSLSDKDATPEKKCGALEPRVNLPCQRQCIDAPVGGSEPTTLDHSLRETFNYTVSQGYTGTVGFHLWFDLPDQVAVQGRILVGGSLACSFDAVQRTVAAGDWTSFERPCTFGAMDDWTRDGPGSATDDQGRTVDGGVSTAKATNSLNVILQVGSTLNYYVGYEGAHAGWAKFGADPPEIKNNTPERPKVEAAKGNAPGIELGLLAAALVGAVEVARRRRSA